jgi:regulator of protease activity HflC (stomatin/prohibitin superfamily)
MLGSAVAAMAVIVALGAYLYQGVASWEHAIAYALPVLMVVLGAETLINLVLDIYRPRAPGVEARASFDSRLLGLISEPGGIAHSLAEALNYQFGFKVSQTWFYQLLQRAFVWLVAVGAVAVWMLTCFVVVRPYERAIIERFGRQIDPQHPLEPGLHFKWPAPIDLARKYNTDQLHEFYVGYRDFDQPKREVQEDVVELWTDRQHGGRDHFDFVISPTPPEELQKRTGEALPPERERRAAADERAAQHLVRMVAVVQYKIDPQKLAQFTQHLESPHAALRKIAWNELMRFAAANHIDALMGEVRDEAGLFLRRRIDERAAELQLGVHIIYVGLLQVHPTKEVAESFRSVVTAQQQKIAEIRKARVSENETLSRVAGDKRKALALAHAIKQVQENELKRGELERMLREQSAEQSPLPRSQLDELRPLIIARLEAEWQLAQERQELERIQKDFELGLGGSLREQARAEQAVATSAAALREAEAALDQVLQPVRAALLEMHEPQIVEAWLARVQAEAALAFWNEQLEQGLTGLEGEAAVTLAEAQARRWELEMRAAGEVALLQNERYAYAVAPEIYKARSYLRVLIDGIQDARKYFLAFEPPPNLHIRFETQEQARPDLLSLPTEAGE